MQKDVYKLIAQRVPPGDNWRIEGGNELIEGLVPTLTSYMRTSKWKGSYKLDPLAGNLYIITQEEIIEEEPEPLDLYGEY